MTASATPAATSARAVPRRRSAATYLLFRSTGAGAAASALRPGTVGQPRSLRGVAVSRTRVHNLFVSLDGYAAGEEVTFDAPIGGARQLFAWFDGRVIHGRSEERRVG